MGLLSSIGKLFLGNTLYGVSVIVLVLICCYMTFFFIRYVMEYFKFKKSIVDISNDELKKLYDKYE